MSSLIGLAGGSSGDAAYYAYTVDNSCRFNDDDDAYMSRAWGAAGTEETWTLSFWAKLAAVSGSRAILSGVYTDDNTRSVLNLTTGGSINLYEKASGVLKWNVATTPVYRDPSAWGHWVVAYDTTQAADANMFKVWFNGVAQAITAGGDYPAQNYVGVINANGTHEIGRHDANVYVGGYDGYLAEFAFIDGTALTPSSFGETNDDGIWVPKDISGLTFDDRSFYLDFKVAPGTGNGAGNDVSGNNNDFTDSGLASNDQSLDTPTENYCTLNSVAGGDPGGTLSPLSDGNLVSTPSTSNHMELSTFVIPTTGKWQFEVTQTGGTIDASTYARYLGLRSFDVGNIMTTAFDNTAYVTFADTSIWYHNTSAQTAFTAVGVNSVWTFAIDFDEDEIEIFDDGSSVGSRDLGKSILGSFCFVFGRHFASGVGSKAGVWTFNFGQRAFAHGQTDYKAINETNIAEEVDWAITKGKTKFNIVLYTGNGSADHAITGVGFQPNIVYIKNRDTSDKGRWSDSTIGTGKYFEPSETGVVISDANAITSFDSDGFTLGTGAAGMNDSTEDFAAWCWITDTTDAKQNVLQWTGTGAAQNVAHGLGVTPDLFWGKSMAAANGHKINHVALSDRSAKAIDPSVASVEFNDTTWASTAPDATNVRVQGDLSIDTHSKSGWVFANVAGYQKHGKYIGSGLADGPFIYCGFRPHHIWLKELDGASTGNWILKDTTRQTYNVDDRYNPFLDTFAIETTGAYEIDILSNGFKVRSTGTDHNANATGYLFSAWAENPFPRSKAR
jgi:hypothetical protein